MNKTPDLISQLRAEIRSAPPAELPLIRGELMTLDAEVLVRLVTPAMAIAIPEDAAGDRLIDVVEAAKMLGMSQSYMYKHRDEYGGEKHGAALRFSTKRLATIMKRRSYNN